MATTDPTSAHAPLAAEYAALHRALAAYQMLAGLLAASCERNAGRFQDDDAARLPEQLAALDLTAGHLARAWTAFSTALDHIADVPIVIAGNGTGGKEHPP